MGREYVDVSWRGGTRELSGCAGKRFARSAARPPCPLLRVHAQASQARGCCQDQSVASSPPSSVAGWLTRLTRCAVLKDGRGKHFPDLFNSAQKILRNTFGMELVQLRAKEGAAGKSASVLLPLHAGSLHPSVNRNTTSYLAAPGPAPLAPQLTPSPAAQTLPSPTSSARRYPLPSSPPSPLAPSRN